MAQMIARHSSSKVAYRCWAGVKDFDPQVMIALLPFTSWQRAKPIPWCREASVSNMTLLVGSKWRVNRLAVRIHLSPANSCLCSGSHWNTFSLPCNCLMAVVACEKSGTKNDSCCARPKNDLTPVRLVGAGKFVIPFILSGSGCTPFPPTIYPAN